MPKVTVGGAGSGRTSTGLGRTGHGLRGGHRWRWVVGLTSAGLVLSGCGLHVSKHGLSGNIMGHSFSATEGALPAGFPSAIPSPDHSRVLGGGGTDNDWDVAFAVTGSISSGTSAYQSKLESSGFAISNMQAGSTPDTTPNSAGATSTTVTLTGATFTAKDSQWTVQVESGSTSSVKGTGLKPGEFAVNITAVPTTTTATTG